MSREGAVVALSTVGTAEDAERIARELVERRLAACVNVVPGLVSIYRWKGAVERGEERLLVVKTRAGRVAALREALVALHPYELPELVVLPVSAGHAPYLAWIAESVGEERSSRPRPRRAPSRGRARGPRRPRSRR